MLSQQPRPIFVRRRIGVLGRVSGNRIMHMRQLAWRVRPLPPRRGIAQPISPLARLHHIRHTDAELRRHRTRAASRSQHPIAQILSVRLPPTPTHPNLRPMPDAHGSQVRGVPESPIAIPAGMKRR